MLAVITCFFNPNRCPYRLANYRVFREHLHRLGVPLYAVELVFGDDPFELTEGSATVLKQIRGKDVMFQKERMLNVALGMVPAEYECVVWMDCDIIYVEDDWPNRVVKALKEYVVVQPYKHAVSLPDGKFERVSECHWNFFDCFGSGRIRRSFAYYNSKRPQFANLHEGHVGYVWAARRSFLEKHKFYDCIITGAGDLLMVMGFYGFFGWMDYIDEFANLTDAACNHFFDWAFPVYEETKGKVGYTDDLICHLWHGDIGNRNYLMKSRHLQANNFDPSVDLALEESGCWRWATDKPRLHAGVGEIFKSQQVL